MRKRLGYKVAAKYIHYREVTGACAKRKDTTCDHCPSRAHCGENLLHIESNRELTAMNQGFMSREE